MKRFEILSLQKKLDKKLSCASWKRRKNIIETVVMVTVKRLVLHVSGQYEIFLYYKYVLIQFVSQSIIVDQHIMVYNSVYFETK